MCNYVAYNRFYKLCFFTFIHISGPKLIEILLRNNQENFLLHKFNKSENFAEELGALFLTHIVKK